MNFDLNALKTPYYIVDEALLTKNLKIMKGIADETGCRVLLAQKAFSMFSLYPLIGEYLSGTTSSGLFEARLAFEEMGKENHIYSPAYSEEEFGEIAAICDHIVFNSFAQWQKFKAAALSAGRECGIRINPEHSTQDYPIYDPCTKGSRLGVTIAEFREDLLGGISGLHFHTLCGQNADALKSTLEEVEKKFGKFFDKIKWLNFGGGQYITKPEYDMEGLISCITKTRDKYGLDIYLEPGEAVAQDAGFLVASVLDIVKNDIEIAVLDVSAACHMPDVIEMPYRPEIVGAAPPGVKKYTYRLGGPTCLAGDIIGDYSFDAPLTPGDRVILCDMAIYTMVKNNTFNGMALPKIATADSNGRVRLIREFSYEDFKNRLS